EKLSNIARDMDVLVTLRIRPGQFQIEHQVIAEIHGDADLDEQRRDEIGDCIVSAGLRTPTQDNDFLADELVEIALRALSPGINDPITAVIAMEWLGAAFSLMASTDEPCSYRGTEDGDFRLYVPDRPIGVYLEQTFGRIRQFAAKNVRAAEGQLRSLALAAVASTDNEDAMALLNVEAKRLVDQAMLSLKGPDLQSLQAVAEQFDRALAARPIAMDEFA
ncbi:MAG: DUF2254 family protein, partial [Pacificimonas sp.]